MPSFLPHFLLGLSLFSISFFDSFISTLSSPSVSSNEFSSKDASNQDIRALTSDASQKFKIVLSRRNIEYSCPYPSSTSGACSKYIVTVNGTSPGPLLRFKQGSIVEVTVVNELFDDLAVVHWHGMTQRNTPFSDGVPSVSQCPLSNDEGHNTMVYIFSPETAGTFWYHGHYNEQYSDGLYGPIIVYRDDEASEIATAGAPYSHDGEDKWIWQIADWYQVPATDLLPWYLSPESGGDEPLPDAYIVNDKFPGHFNITLDDDEPVRVRVINSAALSMFNISVDGMPLKLVELDGITIEPLIVPYVILNVAQRASFVLDWSLLSPTLTSSPSIRFRIKGIPEMYPTFDEFLANHNLIGSTSGEALNLDWVGFIRRATSSASANQEPTYSDSEVPVLDLPVPADPNILEAVPLDTKLRVVAEPDYFINMLVVFQAGEDDNVNRAYINGATHSPDFSDVPSLLQYSTYAAADGTSLPDTSGSIVGNVITGDANQKFYLPFNKTIEVLLNNTDGGGHPFHLHGHYVHVISSNFVPNGAELYKDQYVIRDVITVPAMGWTRFRFLSDNPGAWMFHCHIDWHVRAGLVAEFVEAPEVLKERFTDGTISLPPSHAAACDYQMTSTAGSSLKRASSLVTSLNSKGLFDVSTTKKGSPTSARHAGFQKPTDVKLSNDGNFFYVASRGCNCVKQVAVSTGIQTQLAFAWTNPYGLAIGMDGSIYVTDANRVTKVSSTSLSQVVRVTGCVPSKKNACTSQLNNPKGVAYEQMSSSEYLYIADYGNNAIKRVSLSTAGYPVVVIASGALVQGPTGVAVDTINRILYVTCANNGFLLRIPLTVSDSSLPIILSEENIFSGIHGFDIDDTYAYSASLTGISGIAIDSSNENLFLTTWYSAENINEKEELLHTVKTISLQTKAVINVAGGVNGCLSSSKKCFNDGNAISSQFSSPAGLASGTTSDGSPYLLVADFGNNNIRKVSVASTSSITTSPSKKSPAPKQKLSIRSRSLKL